MHILFLTDNFPPEVNAPASRTFEHCREWVRAGHKVTVITCVPNFPKGQVFDGYRNRLMGREVMAGVEVVRVWSYITANQGFLLRTLDYVSFMLSAIVASVGVRKPDIVVATSPQFFTAVAGYVVGGLRQIPYIFELRDLWPESIRAVGVMAQSPVLDALERLELLLYRKAAMVIAVTKAFKVNLINRGVDPSKIHVVTNGADLSRFHPRNRNKDLAMRLGLQGKFVAGYIGTHGMAHALETILDVARLMKEEKRDDFRFLLLGDGASKRSLRERAESLELDNVLFVDSVEKDLVADYWSLLDVSVIHLRKNELFRTVIPSKLFECMAMGIPILHGVEGESAEIVEQMRVGLVFEPENPEALRDRLIELWGSPALRAELAGNGVAASRGFDRRHLAAVMLEHLEDCLAASGVRRSRLRSKKEVERDNAYGPQ